MGGNYDNLNIVATYNLLYNASLMVEEGVGYALSIDRIIKSYDDSPLCFRPLEPTLEVGLDIVWKKYQTFSKASEKFLEYLKKGIYLNMDITKQRELESTLCFLLSEMIFYFTKPKRFSQALTSLWHFARCRR